MEKEITYDPVIYQVPEIKSSLSDLLAIRTYEISDTYNPPAPLISLGFNPYIYEVKDKMEEVAQHNKHELNIVNRIDIRIPRYQQSLANISEKVFVGEYKIFTRAFYKLWEIMTIFNLCSDKKPITVAGIAEAPASFQQSILYYRSMYGTDNKDDHFYIISLDEPESNTTPKIDRGFIEKYKKHLEVHPTDSSKPDNGDVFKKVVRDNYVQHFKTIKRYANLITADGGAPTHNESRQEQEMFALIFAETALALRCQEKEGHFVLKIFESFTIPTCKLIYLLKCCYENVFIHKPLTSHDTNSEKYLICHRFKFKQGDAQLVQLIAYMEEILLEYNKKVAHTPSYKTYIADFFNLSLFEKKEHAFMDIMRRSSTDIMNLQIFTMQNMFLYMNRKKDNSERQADINKQIKYTQLWEDIFFASKPSRTMLEQLLKTRLNREITFF